MDRESREMLLETAHRFFGDKCTREVVNGVEKGQWPADLWAGIEELGLTLVAVPEEQGGVGGTLEDLLALVRVAGAHAVPVRFTGVLPDLFGEGQGMIGTGKLVNGTFVATEILAKHDESYMPKEVVDALKEQGVYKEPTN